jgi:hypothetical protein
MFEWESLHDVKYRLILNRGIDLSYPRVALRWKRKQRPTMDKQNTFL